MVVCGGQSAGEFLRLLGSGNDFGLRHLNYAYQEEEGGIAEALGLAEYFVGDDKAVVILGDNLFGGSIKKFIKDFFWVFVIIFVIFIPYAEKAFDTVYQFFSKVRFNSFE